MRSWNFVTKSCNHISIAYNIHFSQLKEKGLFKNVATQEEIDRMDPTSKSRALKMGQKK